MDDELAWTVPSRRAALDVSDARIRSALRAGDLVAVRRGVLVGARRLVAATTPSARHAIAIQVAIAATPGPPTYAALGSAASLHGLDRIGRPPERVRLYRRRGSAWRDQHVAVLACGLPPDHVEAVDGVPTTTRARTVVDLARWVTFRSGVVVADSAMRAGTSRQELERVAGDCARWPGVRRARLVLAFADARAATPLESVSRVVFHESGVPAPQLQVPLVVSGEGRPQTIVDFYWEEYGVVGESDGLLKYVDAAALRAEKLRQEELEALGFIVIRWTWDDIWRRPDWVVARLHAAFRRATATSHSGRPQSRPSFGVSWSPAV